MLDSYTLAFDQHTTGIKFDVVIYRLWFTIYQLLPTYCKLSAEAIYSKYEDILQYRTIYAPPDFPVLSLLSTSKNYSVVPFSMQLLEDKGSLSRIWPVITSNRCHKSGQTWWSIVILWPYRVNISTQLNFVSPGSKSTNSGI